MSSESFRGKGKKAKEGERRDERWREEDRERERLKIHLRNLPRDTTSDIGNFCGKITSS